MFFLITFLHNSSYCFAGPEVLSKFEARETRSAENFCQNQILVITVQFRTNVKKYSPVIYLSETIHPRWELWRKPVRALLCWARSVGPSLTKPISQIESCRQKNFARYHSSRNLIATSRERERFLTKKWYYSLFGFRASETIYSFLQWGEFLRGEADRIILQIVSLPSSPDLLFCTEKNQQCHKQAKTRWRKIKIQNQSSKHIISSGRVPIFLAAGREKV